MLLQQKDGILLRLFLVGVSLAVVVRESGGSGNLLDEGGEFRRRLARQGFHVSLKDEKVPRLDEDPNVGEGGFVVRPGDNLPVQVVLPDSADANGPSEACLGAGDGVGVHERGRRAECGRRTSSTHSSTNRRGRTKDEIRQDGTAQITGLYAEDETDGVHEIGLAGTIGTNDGRKVAKGSDGL